MNRLLTRGCWGARYLPVDALVTWIGRRLDRDGKTVRMAIDDLVKEEFLIVHKRRRSPSARPEAGKSRTTSRLP